MSPRLRRALPYPLGWRRFWSVPWRWVDVLRRPRRPRWPRHRRRRPPPRSRRRRPSLPRGCRPRSRRSSSRCTSGGTSRRRPLLPRSCSGANRSRRQGRSLSAVHRRGVEGRADRRGHLGQGRDSGGGGAQVEGCRRLVAFDRAACALTGRRASGSGGRFGCPAGSAGRQLPRRQPAHRRSRRPWRRWGPGDRAGLVRAAGHRGQGQDQLRVDVRRTGGAAADGGLRDRRSARGLPDHRFRRVPATHRRHRRAADESPGRGQGRGVGCDHQSRRKPAHRPPGSGLRAGNATRSPAATSVGRPTRAC